LSVILSQFQDWVAWIFQSGVAGVLLPPPWPVDRPTKVLFWPATLRTGELPMLKLVVEFTTFPDNVPPAVPLPEILKFDVACGTVVFWI